MVMKNGLLSGGLNPQPLSHQSFAFTTRPCLLAIIRNSLSFVLKDYRNRDDKKASDTPQVVEPICGKIQDKLKKTKTF